jgi:hypothetical protein
MKDALVFALKPAIRTLAQALAGGLATLTVASVGDFAALPQLALIVVYGALVAAAVAFLQNVAEQLNAPEA